MKDEVVIVGGGPSLAEFDFDALHGYDTIAVNYSIFSLPCATYFITLDRTFFDKMARRHADFKKTLATKVLVNNLGDRIHEETGELLVRGRKRFDFSNFAMIVRSTRADGIGRSFLDFRHGYNSGYCAVQLAVLLGYRRIRLLGIDLCSHANKMHYHDAYRVNRGCMPVYTRYFLDGIRDLKGNWPSVEVVSHSPISPLNQVVRYEGFVSPPGRLAGNPNVRLDSLERSGSAPVSLAPSKRTGLQSLSAHFFRTCRGLFSAWP